MSSPGNEELMEDEWDELPDDLEEHSSSGSSEADMISLLEFVQEVEVWIQENMDQDEGDGRMEEEDLEDEAMEEAELVEDGVFYMNETAKAAEEGSG